MPHHWIKTLRPASFRGQRFLVETEKASGGRRVKLHVFPHGETGYNEDLGKKTRRYNLTAYLASASADRAAIALASALDAPGAASLVLPMWGRKQANCLDWSADRHKDKHGYVAFTLSFAEYQGLSVLAPLGLLVRLVDEFTGNMAPFSKLFAENFQGIGVADFVQKSAIATVQDFAGLLENGLSGVVLGQNGGDIATRLHSLKTDAASLLASGTRPDQFGTSRFIRQNVTRPPLLPDAIFTLFGTMSEAMSAPDMAVMMRPLLLKESATIQTGTASRIREAKNRAAITDLVRQAALLHYTRAVVNQDYYERPDAIQARADVAEYLGFELERVSQHGARGREIYALLQDLRGKAADSLSRALTDLAPILFIEAPRSMPSLYWSNRLYGTASQAENLIARNGVIHASFMPRQFEASAR